MGSVHALWMPIYNAFDPWQVLWGQDLDRFFVERPDRPLAEVGAELAGSHMPLKVLLTGHRGSGKSTALAELVRRLADDFFIVWLDVEKSTDIFNVNHVEVLFLIGVAVFGVAEEQLGQKPARARLDRLVDSLSTLVREQTDRKDFAINVDQILDALIAGSLGATAVSASPMAAAIAGVATLARGIRFTLGLSEEVVGKLEVKPRIGEIITCLNDIVEDVIHKADKPLLLIVDGLDKVELEQARSIFAESLLLREPICHVVYTAPILLYYSPHFASARQLFTTCEFPNVKLHERDDRTRIYPPGYETMREVVRKRLRALGLQPEAVIGSQVLDKLVEMSGGVMRELIALMRKASVKAQLAGVERITETIAEKAIYDLRRNYSAGLSEPYYKALGRIMELKRPTGTKECDELLQNLYILSYVNDDLWYDVHPNVLALIEGVE